MLPVSRPAETKRVRKTGHEVRPGATNSVSAALSFHDAPKRLVSHGRTPTLSGSRRLTAERRPLIVAGEERGVAAERRGVADEEAGNLMLRVRLRGQLDEADVRGDLVVERREGRARAPARRRPDRRGRPMTIEPLR